MTLIQHSPLRGRTTLRIEDGNLQYSFHSFAGDYRFEVPLADLRATFDELRQTAWPWSLVGLAALAFLVFHFRHGLLLDSLNAMFAVVYISFGLYALGVAYKRSGRFLIVRGEGVEPRVIWIRRESPSRDSVDAFIAELKRAIQQAKNAEPGATANAGSAHSSR